MKHSFIFFLYFFALTFYPLAFAAVLVEWNSWSLLLPCLWLYCTGISFPNFFGFTFLHSWKRFSDDLLWRRTFPYVSCLSCILSLLGYLSYCNPYISCSLSLLGYLWYWNFNCYSFSYSMKTGIHYSRTIRAITTKDQRSHYDKGSDINNSWR